MGVSLFADMTHEEFKHMLGLQNKNKPILNATVHKFPENLEAPESINWVEKGAVLAVKNQGECGSCWAFSATGSLEGQNAILNKAKTPLSEQQLLDCSGSYGNGNCNVGGLMTYAFQYIQDNGIESESSYPYKGNQKTCSSKASKTVLKIKGYKEIEPTENKLKNAVGTIGPISVAINGDYLQFYSGGIVNEPYCYASLDHGVLAVGYGSSSGTKFWIVKNSWGSSWGEKGYFKLERDANNMCGIASMTSYPLL